MAGRIFITGDTHGDFSRFGLDTFPMQTKLDKKDYVIILGDFGGVWNHNNSIAFQIEEQNLDALDNKSFSTLFIEGNHERYDRLYACPVETWHGGKVHRIRPNILHLMRGQIFNIAGRKFFAMGGAASHDYAVLLNQTESDYHDRKELLIADDIPFRTEGVDYWKEELPTIDEMKEGKDNLVHNKKVDYILTHCASTSTQNCLNSKRYQSNILTDYLDDIKSMVEYKKWYFGHYHINYAFNEKESCLYDTIVELN